MHSKLLLFCLLSLPVFAAGQSHFPSNEDLRHIRNLNGPRLSPDGREVLVRVTESAADGGKAHVWLIDIGSNSYRQLTFAPAGKEKDDKYRGETAAEWLPDGDILFLAHRGENTQLFRLPMRGGEATAFDLKVLPAVDNSKLPGALPPPEASTENSKARNSKSEGSKGDASSSESAKKDEKPEPIAIDVSGFEVSPDGKAVALWADDPQTAGEKKQEEEKADAVWVDHEQHATRLYLLDVASGKLTAAAVPPQVQGVSWSLDSSRLTAGVEAPNNANDLGPANSAWLVERDDPEHPHKLALPATVDQTDWSFDGKSIFYFAQSQDDAPPGYDDLYVVPVSGGAGLNLSRTLVGSVSGSGVITMADGSALTIVESGEHLGVVRFASQGAPQKIDLGTSAVRNLVTNTRRSGFVFVASSSAGPDELRYTESLGSPAKTLATPVLVPAGLEGVPSQLVRWQSDGRTIEGLLYMPPNATGKAPLIVDVHGGPTGAWLDGYDSFINFIVGHGWAVLRPNPRGSTGRGAAFAAANKNDLGGGDYRDIMAGVDYALKNFPLDANRMALMGYSYGGEMAGFVEGKTNRFKAIVCGAPVIDQFSEYGTEDDSWYDRWFFGKPWERQTDALRQSPLAGAAHASTPFLLLQGQEDSTDPAGQSREMYRALRQMGVPVDLVEYPRDNHGPLAGAIFGAPVREPWHGYDARQRIVEFIERAFAAKVTRSTVNSSQ